VAAILNRDLVEHAFESIRPAVSLLLRDAMPDRAGVAVVVAATEAINPKFRSTGGTFRRACYLVSAIGDIATSPYPNTEIALSKAELSVPDGPPDREPSAALLAAGRYNLLGIGRSGRYCRRLRRARAAPRRNDRLLGCRRRPGRMPPRARNPPFGQNYRQFPRSLGGRVWGPPETSPVCSMRLCQAILQALPVKVVDAKRSVQPRGIRGFARNERLLWMAPALQVRFDDLA